MQTIVFSDVDGTLLNSENKITAGTQAAIRALAQRGVPFVIASGRSPSGIFSIFEEYAFRCPVVAYSGALILDENKKVLFHEGIEKAAASNIIDFLESSGLDLSWCIYSLDQWIVKEKQDARIISEERTVNAAAIEGGIETVTDAVVNKIMCICNPEKILEIEATIKAAFPGYSIMKSSDVLLEIMKQGISKATAVQVLCSLWDIPVENTIAFGDNYNDVEMLEAVGHGFLMGNAPDSLKKRIPVHTGDNDHEGIYCGLMKMNLL